MHIDVIKFGGSSLADNEKLKLAAKKTISFLEKAEDNKIVVIVSAQGKTTDHFIGEAKELSFIPHLLQQNSKFCSTNLFSHRY